MNEQEAKYTPGPWKVAENGFSVYASDPHFVVASTLTPDSMLIGQQEELDAVRGTQRANAHLLAASILMLEALQRLEWSWHDEGDARCPYCWAYRDTKQHKHGCVLDVSIKAALNLD